MLLPVARERKGKVGIRSPNYDSLYRSLNTDLHECESEIVFARGIIELVSLSCLHPCFLEKNKAKQHNTKLICFRVPQPASEVRT